jgi:DNA-binding MurR/RpiR family transcriptional regulator
MLTTLHRLGAKETESSTADSRVNDMLSPAAEVADLVLPVKVDGLGPFNSVVSATAIVKSLVAGILGKPGDRADRRIRRTDELTKRVTSD